MTGKLSVSYELSMPDLEVLDPGPFTREIAASRPWTATLQPSPTGLTLRIDIETDDVSNSLIAADSYAAEIADHLTFWFSDHVKQAVVPSRVLKK